MIKVSLAIPVRDEAETIGPLIESIQRQRRKPDEVIFVDGGSADGTLEILQRKCDEDPTFRLIKARRALPGHGRNIAVANASFDWIAFTDAGIRLEPDWLEQLVGVAESDPQTGIVCGNFEPVVDSFFKQCAAIAYVEARTPRASGLGRSPFIASSLVRRHVWHQVGGFPDLRAAEDLVFFEEIERQGFKFSWAPRALVHWQLRPNLLSTYRRFVLYSCVNVWAGRQRYWHYGIAKLYALALPFFVLSIWKSWWWLLVPLAGLSLRVLKRIWNWQDHGRVMFTLNPLRFFYVAVITLSVDLATFVGWFKALANRQEARRIANQMHTRRGD